MADLMADLNATEMKLAVDIESLKDPPSSSASQPPSHASQPPQGTLPPAPQGLSSYDVSNLPSPVSLQGDAGTPSSRPRSHQSPLPPPQHAKPSMVSG